MECPAEIPFLFDVLIDFCAESFMHSGCLRTSTATGRRFNYTYNWQKFVAEGRSLQCRNGTKMKYSNKIFI